MMMTASTTQPADAAQRETDTILRLGARDLVVTLHMFSGNRESTTFENIRLRLCLDRKHRRKGDYLWSTAVDVVTELRKLGLVDMSVVPRDRKQYEHAKDATVTVTTEGLSLVRLLQDDIGAAYDKLFVLLYNAHPYLRRLAVALGQQDLLVPVLTSLKDHVAPRYASASVLVDEVSKGIFEFEPLLGNLEKRMDRALESSESHEIEEGIQQIVDQAGVAATTDDPSSFAKKFLDRLNNAVVPVLLHRYGMDFDYRTHRTLWQLGRDFQVWWATSSHPGYPGTLIFSTAHLQMSDTGEALKEIVYPASLSVVRQGFMEKLYNAYLTHSRLVGNTYVPTWELRAIFCHEQRCQPVAFNKLLEEHYKGVPPYSIHLEIERTKPRHEETLMVGKRRIGTIRVTKLQAS
jgi:hypothetical protein